MTKSIIHKIEMLRKLELLVTLPHRNKATVYLFEKNTKTLLPLEIKGWQKTNNIVCKNVIALFALLGCKLEFVHIYVNPGVNTTAVFSNGTQYTWLCTNVCLGLSLAKYADVPIYSDTHLINLEGIPITKEMIEKALEENRVD